MPNSSEIRDSISERSGLEVSPLDSLTQEVYDVLCTWMQTARVEQRVSKLCQSVLEAFAVPAGADELLSKVLGFLYSGLQQIYKEYTVFVGKETHRYGQDFPFCLDHLTIVLLESAVHDDRHAQLLEYYLGGTVDQSEEAWKLLSNCPKGCASHRCFNLSPHHEFCSTHCEERHAADSANAARASEEQAEAERVSATQAEVELTSVKHHAVVDAPIKSKKKPVRYSVGHGESLAKSVRFCVTPEPVAIGLALSQTNIKTADVVFLTGQTHGECNPNGKKTHRHSTKFVIRICKNRLAALAAVYSTGLTDKRKQLKSTIDGELFSSIVAHITLQIDYIVHTTGVEVLEHLDSTLQDYIGIKHWKTLRIVGNSHSMWAKTLKQIASDDRSQPPCKPVLNAPSVLDNQVPNTGYKSVRVLDGDDGDNGDDDESNDDEEEVGGGNRSPPASADYTGAEPYDESDSKSDYSSEGDSQARKRVSDNGSDTDFGEDSDCEIEPEKKATPKGRPARIQ